MLGRDCDENDSLGIAHTICLILSTDAMHPISMSCGRWIFPSFLYFLYFINNLLVFDFFDFFFYFGYLSYPFPPVVVPIDSVLSLLVRTRPARGL